MDQLAELDAAIERGRTTKVAYVQAVEELKRLSRDLWTFRRKFTLDAWRAQPELLKRWRAAYKEGERIKNEMYAGKRWPGGNGTTYAHILSAVPEAQRSPEVIACLKAWEEWNSCNAEWNRLFPPPQHLYWIGPALRGPNLWADHGIPGTPEDSLNLPGD